MASRVSELTALAHSYLRPWEGGVSQSSVDEAHLRWADYHDPQWGGALPLGEARNRLLRLNILGGKLYWVNCVGSGSPKRLARQQAILRLVSSVLDSHKLPDLDLVVAISDRPTVPRHAAKATPPPVFGYTKTPWHHSIPFPYSTFDPARWSALYTQLGRWRPLAERRPAAVWRGTCNSLCDMRKPPCSERKDAALLDRLALLRAARKCAPTADVAVVHPQTARQRNALRRYCGAATPRRSIPMAAHANYTLLVHVDGNGFSGRLEELLTLGGAVLKQDSPFEAFYYPLLKRATHYEPVARDFSDFCHTVRRLLDDPAAATRLALRATAFVERYLSPERVREYVAALLTRYARLQRFAPKRHAVAVPWPPPADSASRAALNATAMRSVQ